MITARDYKELISNIKLNQWRWRILPCSILSTAEQLASFPFHPVVVVGFASRRESSSQLHCDAGNVLTSQRDEEWTSSKQRKGPFLHVWFTLIQHLSIVTEHYVTHTVLWSQDRRRKTSWSREGNNCRRIIHFSSIFICVLIPHSKGQLQSKHDQKRAKNRTHKYK